MFWYLTTYGSISHVMPDLLGPLSPKLQHEDCDLQQEIISSTVNLTRFPNHNKHHTCVLCISMQELCRTCKCIYYLSATIFCETWHCYHLWFACEHCLQIAFVKQAHEHKPLAFIKCRAMWSCPAHTGHEDTPSCCDSNVRAVKIHNP